MAFDINGFRMKEVGGCAGPSGQFRFLEASYITPEAPAAVEAAHYFDSLYQNLVPGVVIRSVMGVGGSPVYKDYVVTSSLKNNVAIQAADVAAATAAGADGQLQYASGGSFAASADLLWDNANKRLQIRSGTDGFELRGRAAADTGLSCGVPYFRSTNANEPTAFDVMPNGVPATYFFSWIDVCNLDLSGGGSNYQSIKLAINASSCTVGSDAGGSSTPLPLNVVGPTISFNSQASGVITEYGTIHDAHSWRFGNSGDVNGYWLNLTQFKASMPAGYLLNWNSTATVFGTNDAGITRNGAGLVEINNGTAGTLRDLTCRDLYTNDAAFILRTKTAITSGAGAQTGTLTNGPAAGNPTKWLPVDDNGTTRYVPAW